MFLYHVSGKRSAAECKRKVIARINVKNNKRSTLKYNKSFPCEEWLYFSQSSVLTSNNFVLVSLSNNYISLEEALSLVFFPVDLFKQADPLHKLFPQLLASHVFRGTGNRAESSPSSKKEKLIFRFLADLHFRTKENDDFELFSKLISSKFQIDYRCFWGSSQEQCPRLHRRESGRLFGLCIFCIESSWHPLIFRKVFRRLVSFLEHSVSPYIFLCAYK